MLNINLSIEGNQMKKEEDIIEKIKSEEDDSFFDKSIYNINSWGADLSFRELVTMYKDGDLLKPEIQREYVWDKIEASFFIDSILLGLPLPSVFLAKTKDEKMLIIDGFQRIMTVYDYIEGIFSKDKKVFRLSKSPKINPKWQGKAFSELNELDQRKIKNTTIHSIIFVQVHPKTGDTSLYQVFERINTSGRTLMSQEIRNCVYQGRFNKMLIELNKSEIWRKLYGLDDPDSRMRDIEFILRFFALNSNPFEKDDTGMISLKKFLNEFMDEMNNKDLKFLNALKEEFLNVTKSVFKYFGENSFRNLSEKYPDTFTNKFSPTIFDSIMLATSNALKHNKKIDAKNIQARHLKLLKSTKYQYFISTRTTNIENIQGRVSLAAKILYGLKNE